MTAGFPSRSANGRIRRSGRNLRVAVYILIAGLVLGLFGPFGTYQGMPAAVRIPYWVLTMAAFGSFAVPIHRAAARLLMPRLPEWAVTMAVSGVTAVFGALILRAGLPLIVNSRGLPDLPLLTVQVFLVTVCVTAVILAFERRRAAPAPQEAADPGAPSAAWRERLPPDLRDAELLALEAEDHYLRVHTTAGSALILMRLADAAAELGPERGAQVHRSFWVAKNVVEKVERDAGRATLVLRGGLRVPVSRGNQAKLAEMGWAKG